MIKTIVECVSGAVNYNIQYPDNRLTKPLSNRRCSCADGLYGEHGEGLFGQENGWSGAPLLSKASMSLKKTKAAILTDDEVDDYDWTCQGCLVWPLLAAAVICLGVGG